MENNLDFIDMGSFYDFNDKAGLKRRNIARFAGCGKLYFEVLSD